MPGLRKSIHGGRAGTLPAADEGGPSRHGSRPAVRDGGRYQERGGNLIAHSSVFTVVPRLGTFGSGQALALALARCGAGMLR